MIEVHCDSPCKRSPVTGTTAGVAAVTARHHVGLMIAAPLTMRRQVVKRQLRAVLDSLATVTAGEAVAEVERQAFFFAHEVHALAALRVSVSDLLLLCHRPALSSGGAHITYL